MPFDLADVGADGAALRCTEAEFRDLAPAEETLAEFTPGYGVPVQLLRPAGAARGAVRRRRGDPRIPERAVADVIPPGEVEEHRGAPVHATDGDVGQLRARASTPPAAR